MNQNTYNPTKLELELANDPSVYWWHCSGCRAAFTGTPTRIVVASNLVVFHDRALGTSPVERFCIECAPAVETLLASGETPKQKGGEMCPNCGERPSLIASRYCSSCLRDQTPPTAPTMTSANREL